jgi:hypothetical protein
MLDPDEAEIADAEFGPRFTPPGEGGVEGSSGKPAGESMEIPGQEVGLAAPGDVNQTRTSVGEDDTQPTGDSDTSSPATPVEEALFEIPESARRYRDDG